MHPFLKSILPALDYAALFLFCWIGAFVFGVGWTANFLPQKDGGDNMFQVLFAAVGLVLLGFLAVALYLDFFKKPRGKGRFLLAFALSFFYLWQFINFSSPRQMVVAGGLFLAYAALRLWAFLAPVV